MVEDFIIRMFFVEMLLYQIKKQFADWGFDVYAVGWLEVNNFTFPLSFLSAICQISFVNGTPFSKGKRAS